MFLNFVTGFTQVCYHIAVVIFISFIMPLTSYSFYSSCVSFNYFSMLYMALLGFIGPPKPSEPPWYQSSRSPLNLSGRTFSYFGPPYQYLCKTLNTCIALKQFNLLPPNTMFWSNFIYYSLTHQFEAITQGWIKTCVKWFWDNS